LERASSKRLPQRVTPITPAHNFSPELFKHLRQSPQSRLSLDTLRGWGIETEEDLTAALLLFAKEDPSSLIKAVATLPLREPARLLLAEACADQVGGMTAQHIQNFRIKDESARCAIAQRCFQNNPRAAAPYLSFFNIKDPTALINACIQQDAAAITPYLDSLTRRLSPEERRQCAQACFQHVGPQIFAANIQAFNLSEEDRLHYAILLSRTKPEVLACFIDRFEIQDLDARYDLAVECSINAPKEVAEHITQFGLTPHTRFCIAELCVHYALPDELPSLFHSLKFFEIEGMENNLDYAYLRMDWREKLVACALKNPVEVEKQLPSIPALLDHDRVMIQQACSDSLGASSSLTSLPSISARSSPIEQTPKSPVKLPPLR
jgi:hypothetical protein